MGREEGQEALRELNRAITARKGILPIHVIDIYEPVVSAAVDLFESLPTALKGHYSAIIKGKVDEADILNKYGLSQVLSDEEKAFLNIRFMSALFLISDDPVNGEKKVNALLQWNDEFSYSEKKAGLLKKYEDILRELMHDCLHLPYYRYYKEDSKLSSSLCNLFQSVSLV